jgi:hypothetical protein
MADSIRYENARGALMTRAQSPAYQAYQLLHLVFIVAPIVAGADKFFHALVNWDQYCAPAVANVFGGNVHGFMLVAGCIEIVVGIGVALKPKVFAYVVAAWLVGIIINLLLIPGYFDIALRDFGLCLGALALGRLSQHFDHQFEHTDRTDTVTT